MVEYFIPLGYVSLVMLILINTNINPIKDIVIIKII